MNLDMRRHAQRFLWIDDPQPPYVRFERVSRRRFVVWVAAEKNLDIEDLDRALGCGTGPHGVVRSFIQFAGYRLTPVEDDLLTRYREGDTGPQFWEDVEAAGLLYEPEPKAPSKPEPRRPVVSIPLSTAAPFIALTKALTHTAPGDWTPLDGEIAAESGHTFADFRVRLAMQPDASGIPHWLPRAPSGVAGDMAETLRYYGGQRACLTAQACTYLAAGRPGVPVSFDQILHELAYKRPSGRVDARAHRRAAKREAYAHVLLGQQTVAVGSIRRTVDGRRAGHEAWALYAVDHVSFDADGTPDTITFQPAGLSRLIAENPAVLEHVGNVRDLLVLPNTTPGRWAAAILYALRLHWRLNVRSARLHMNTGGERQALEFAPIPRRRLFAVMRPDSPTPEELLAGGDARRAIEYFDEAMRILQGKRGGANGSSVRVSFWRPLPTSKSRLGVEPWELAAPGAKPRVGRWSDPWLEQRLDVRPGGTDLTELLRLRERVRVARRGLRHGRSAGALPVRRDDQPVRT